MERFRFNAVAITACCLFLFLNRVVAQEAPRDTSYYLIFEKALAKYHNEEYETAIQLATQLRVDYPDLPAGAFGLMATYQTIMRNYRVKLYESRLDSLMDLSIKLAKKAVKKNKRDGMNYFYLGCAYGSRSVYYARRGKWLDAFKDGTKVMNSFQKAVKYDPRCYDSYYGLGLYNYWLGASTKLLRILPFSKNKKKQGVEQVKLAVEKGRFLKVDGLYGLSTVYYNEGEYEKALEICNQLYAKYPNNPSLLYKKGRILKALKRWPEAIETFEQLYDQLQSVKYQSVSFKVDCLYQLAACQFQAGNTLDSWRNAQKAVELDKDCDMSKELDGPFDKHSDIEKQLQALNKKVSALNLTQVANESIN
ncbi:MAG: tetratricopeptide repeat protein [bacterium]